MIPTTQLENESTKAYEAFRCYLDMGGKRSQERVSKKLSKSRQYIGRLASNFHWVERVRTAGLESHQIDRSAEEQAALEAARVNEALKKQTEADTLKATAKFVEKLDAMLNFPLQTSRTKDDVIKEGGKTIHRHITIMPAKWTFADAARIAQIIDQLRRVTLGMPLGRQEITGKDGAPFAPVAPPIINVIHLRDEQSDAAKRLFGDARPSAR